MIVESENLLVIELRKELDLGNVIIIGVDGKDGVGKSTLSKNLSKFLNIELVVLDEFLVKKNGEFVNSLDMLKIKNFIENVKHPVIIEGVCLLLVAKKLKIKIDKLIYIKKTSFYGIWRDRQECNPQIPVHELVKKIEDEMNNFHKFEDIMNNTNIEKEKDKISLPNLSREIIQYHADFRPADNANYIFHVVENQ